jgi:hypothetical protein
VGKTYTAPDGKTFRPSLFVTLTCPSYGRVGEDGTPADPGTYDYDRAARDALTFAALFDRFIQNLRRYLGYDVQYFAAIEPRRRLAPHVHLAIRGTVSRAELRRVRWTVAGREKSHTLAGRARAERYKSRLLQAADKGEAFDVESGLPESLAREVSRVTWFEHASAFMDARWPRHAGKAGSLWPRGLSP